VWHAPTYTKEKYNACEWCIIFADALGIKHSSPAPGTGVGPLARHGDDVPEDERPMPEDSAETKKAKEAKAAERKEKIDKARAEKEKEGDPELHMTIMYENFVYAQSFLSGFMSEIEDTKYQNVNDHVFNSAKFEKRFPDIKPTKPQDAATEIVLIEVRAVFTSIHLFVEFVFRALAYSHLSCYPSHHCVRYNFTHYS
jgi:hypothetical protein